LNFVAQLSRKLTLNYRLHYIDGMTRTQIQLPEPLFQRLKLIASARDWSVAELIRRGMEVYAQTCPELSLDTKTWSMPMLRGSGGHLVDPASVSVEADAILSRQL
jgi:hypothetical protein